MCKLFVRFLWPRQGYQDAMRAHPDLLAKGLRENPATRQHLDKLKSQQRAIGASGGRGHRRSWHVDRIMAAFEQVCSDFRSLSRLALTQPTLSRTHFMILGASYVCCDRSESHRPLPPTPHPHLFAFFDFCLVFKLTMHLIEMNAPSHCCSAKRKLPRDSSFFSGCSGSRQSLQALIEHHRGDQHH